MEPTMSFFPVINSVNWLLLTCLRVQSRITDLEDLYFLFVWESKNIHIEWKLNLLRGVHLGRYVVLNSHKIRRNICYTYKTTPRPLWHRYIHKYLNSLSWCVAANVSVQEENLENASHGSDRATALGCYGVGLESLASSIQPWGCYGIIKSW